MYQLLDRIPPMPRRSNVLKRLSLAFSLVGCSCVMQDVAWGRTWYVLPDGTGDAPNAQAAMDSAQAGDEVLLAAGEHTYETDYGVLMKTGVLLRGESGPGASILNGRAVRGSPVRCQATGPGTIIEGLTLMGGSGGDFPFLAGAGISCQSSEVTIRNCNIRDNRRGDPTLSWGASVSAVGSRVTIEDCIIDNNTSTPAVGVALSDLDIRNSLILYTGVPNDDALAIQVSNDASGTTSLSRSVIAGHGVSIGGFGGAMVRDNTLHGGLGLAFSSPQGTVAVERNVIARSRYGFLCGDCSGASLLLACNDLWDASVALYSGISDQTGVNGNISADPQFCNATSLDFHLNASSPALLQQCGPMGGQGVGCGVTPAIDISWGSIKDRYH